MFVDIMGHPYTQIYLIQRYEFSYNMSENQTKYTIMSPWIMKILVIQQYNLPQIKIIPQNTNQENIIYPSIWNILLW